MYINEQKKLIIIKKNYSPIAFRAQLLHKVMSVA